VGALGVTGLAFLFLNPCSGRPLVGAGVGRRLWRAQRYWQSTMAFWREVGETLSEGNAAPLTCLVRDATPDQE